ARKKYVLDAMNNVEEGVWIHTRNVARREPAIGLQRVRRFRRVVPIAGHDLRTTHPEFAALACWDLTAFFINDFCLGVRNGQSDGPLDGESEGDVAMGNGRRLGRNV